MIQPGLGLTFARAPVTLLAGYLGAGKTTLLNRLLTEPHGQRIAVVINEFGEESIDDKLIVKTDDEIIEMANGCMCCVVKDDTRDALFAMKERRLGRFGTPLVFDRVVIEASGVANPVPVMRMLLEDELLVDGYTLDGVLALVDAFNIKTQLARATEVKQQIACADVVVVNKIDRVHEENLPAIVRRVAGLNPRARIVPTQHANVPLVDIFSINGFGRELVISEYYDSHNNDDDVQSLVVRAVRPLVRHAFEEWLSCNIILRADDMYRYKGIIAFEGNPALTIVQGVHAYFDMHTGELWQIGDRHESVLVLIGRDLDRLALEEGFKSCQTF